MAWFTYQCEVHGNFRATLEKRRKNIPCPKCGSNCRAIIRVGTAQVKERLDNGAMGRAVERLHNIEEIMEERSKKYSPQDDSEE